MEKEILDNKQALINWLADPRELGHIPANVEYTNMFEDEDGNKCYIYKYKEKRFGKWFLGIVSAAGVFSEMREYNQITEIEDAKKILNMLKEYWKNLAKQYQEKKANNDIPEKKSMPKITSEDIFDDNKMILDEQDKKRISKIKRSYR